MGYTKLFSEIVTSTIWQEPNDCRVLWITMLALKDEENICRATLPALAKICNLTIEQTEAYLQKFQEPDKYSRSQAFEGKRIELVDGGWLILNGQKYRDMLRAKERRDYVREKVAEHRAGAVNKCKQCNQVVNKCKQCNQCKPITEADSEADSEVKEDLCHRRIAPNDHICPHEEIIKIYHEVLPACQPVRIWTPARKAMLQARWREDQKRQDLKWWRGYFEFISRSPFLMGQVEPTNGRRPFRASLEWLIRPSNFANINEGKYK
ncbi:MAG: hypothetical protein MN733_40935 [Nitrososphaera sp.]|nr:hypothetical protein [Nitrososphaera sp.]